MGSTRVEESCVSLLGRWRRYSADAPGEQIKGPLKRHPQSVTESASYREKAEFEIDVGGGQTRVAGPPSARYTAGKQPCSPRAWYPDIARGI
jgi:hypothetical protein